MYVCRDVFTTFTRSPAWKHEVVLFSLSVDLLVAPELLELRGPQGSRWASARGRNGMYDSSSSQNRELKAMEPRRDEWFLRAEAKPGELPYTMLASMKEVMALSCSRWRWGRTRVSQLGAERKKGIQLWTPLRGSDSGIWEGNYAV